MRRDDDYEVIWAGRGAMPHEERDRPYWRMKGNITDLALAEGPRSRELVTHHDESRVWCAAHCQRFVSMGDQRSGYKTCQSCRRKRSPQPEDCPICAALRRTCFRCVKRQVGLASMRRSA